MSENLHAVDNSLFKKVQELDEDLNERVAELKETDNKSSLSSIYECTYSPNNGILPFQTKRKPIKEYLTLRNIVCIFAFCTHKSRINIIFLTFQLVKKWMKKWKSFPTISIEISTI